MYRKGVYNEFSNRQKDLLVVQCADVGGLVTLASFLVPVVVSVSVSSLTLNKYRRHVVISCIMDCERLFTFVLCRILVLGDGKVQELGAPSELLKNENGQFYSMVKQAGLI